MSGRLRCDVLYLVNLLSALCCLYALQFLSSAHNKFVPAKHVCCFCNGCASLTSIRAVSCICAVTCKWQPTLNMVSARVLQTSLMVSNLTNVSSGVQTTDTQETERTNNRKDAKTKDVGCEIHDLVVM